MSYRSSTCRRGTHTDILLGDCLLVVGTGSIKPLLFDEILTISLYGTLDELSELEGYLASEELSDIKNVQQSVLDLAQRVKDRLKMGLKTTCCPVCKHYYTCIRKWLRAEREMNSNCCFRCGEYADCAEHCKKQQLKKVVHSTRPALQCEEHNPPPSQGDQWKVY